jgi:RNA polymerase sigma factor (sigma-70 family)
MASVLSGATFLNDIHRIFQGETVAGQSDGQLLERFVDRRDEAAFGALVARYGPMVLAVCRGVLKDAGAGEDAFQATFLVLVRRASSVHQGEALGAWLHRVAVRVAIEANRASCRRRNAERTAGERATMIPQLDWEREGWSSLLHEELDRLPGRYRLPIVLCHVQDLTHSQAADQLRLSVGTFRRRLNRGRELLRQRLTRRGAGIAGGLTAAWLAPPAKAAVPAAWVNATIKAAASASASRAVATGAGSAAAALAEGVLRAMFITRLKWAAAIVVGMTCVSVATGVVIRASAGGAKPAGKTQALTTAVARQRLPSPAQAEPQERDDTLTVRGRVLGPDGKPFAGAKLYLGNINVERTHELPEPRAIAGPDGRFLFALTRAQREAADSRDVWRSPPIIAAAEGYGPDWVEPDKVGESEITLQLVKDDVPIEGRVLDLQGKPVSGAFVKLHAIKAPTGNDLEPYLALVRDDPFAASNYNFAKQLSAETRIPGQTASIATSVDGRFLIRGIGRDRVVEITVESAGIQSATLTTITRAGGPFTSAPGKEGGMSLLGATFDHLAAPGRALTGVVRDQASKAPLAHFSVGGTATTSRMITGPDGRFTLTGFPKGRDYALIAVPQNGIPYFNTCVRVPDTAGLDPISADIECVRGIPYRLKLIDKQTGMPVRKANVVYEPIYPNPHTREVRGFGPINGVGPYNTAHEESDGTYISAVLPGPGALCVRLRNAHSYMPACVDPAAFFKDVPNATLDGKAYGDRTLLFMAIDGDGMSALPQEQFTAIILVNPPVESKPLEIEYAVAPDPNLKVTVLGPGAERIEGLTGDGAIATPDPTIFSVARLNPLRPRRVIFTQSEKQLVGFLLARGDELQRPTVTLQPWGTVTGRLVSASGKPRPKIRFQTKDWETVIFDPKVGMLPSGGAQTDTEGRFRIERLVPGQKYSAIVIGLTPPDDGFGSVFEELIVMPGQTKDLGDIRATMSRGGQVE